MVEVIYFPKPCPHCKDILFPVNKMYHSWLECRNDNCAYLTSPIQEELKAKAMYPELFEPQPYIYAYTR